MSQLTTFNPIDPESVSSHLVCPDTQLSIRPMLVASLVEAYVMVLRFAEVNQWQGLMQEPLFNSAQIFDSQEELWSAIKKPTQASETKLPTDGLSAAICSGLLMVITPELFSRIRPEYACIDKPWTRLVAHEIIHQLHVRLAGSEERMGPQWFYEGFAMHAAGQLFNINIKSLKEAIDAVNTDSKHRGSYAKYVAAFEFFLDKVELGLMLQHAPDDDFESWLAAKAAA